jgi:hypothetical protein
MLLFNTWQMLILPIYFSYWLRPVKIKMLYSWLCVFTLTIANITYSILSRSFSDGFEIWVVMPCVSIYSATMGTLLSTLVDPVVVASSTDDDIVSRSTKFILFFYALLVLTVHLTELFVSGYFVLSYLIVPLCGLTLIAIATLGWFHKIYRMNFYNNELEDPTRMRYHIRVGVFYWFIMVVFITITNYVLLVDRKMHPLRGYMTKDVSAAFCAVNISWFVVLIAAVAKGFSKPNLNMPIINLPIGHNKT